MSANGECRLAPSFDGDVAVLPAALQQLVAALSQVFVACEHLISTDPAAPADAVPGDDKAGLTKKCARLGDGVVAVPVATRVDQLEFDIHAHLVRGRTRLRCSTYWP